MGRRKIEIRPIKDDRNRSVTFLKRRGGLFKKAYELGVLCSVDVAVIIFGHNKKLYEYSSGDINDTIGRFQYYAGAHEHKGPDDFAGKGGGDDDEDEDGDMGSPPPNSHSPPEPAQMTHNLHHQPGLQHIRHATPSASPPMPNGNIPMQHRASPQPGMMSRPSSRTAQPRRPSNLAPPQFNQPQPQMPQPGYAYAQGQQYYSHQQQAIPRGQPTPPYPTPAQAQMQHAYMQDQRRQSLPPGYQNQGQHIPPPQPSPQPHLQPPDPQSLSRRHTPQPNEHYQSPPLPQPKPISQAKSNSIFTPIEDSRSLLAQHWGAPPTSDGPIDHNIKQDNRSQSIDVGTISYDRMNGTSPRPPQSALSNLSAQSAQYPPPPPVPQRTNSASSLPSLAPPSRSSTMQSDARRPRLKVQIPSEASDGGDPDTSARDPASAAPMNAPPKGVVLPPPSPSANNPLLSAGASGPPNPFARPAPPPNQSLNRELETPLSALPSRVMEGNMLPSPSDIWGSMFSRSNNDNMMPSPLNFQPTPIATSGASFRDDPDDRKRKADADLSNSEKRIRT
ncbi:Transcription factor RLM1 [Elsinoe australis]|uniref:Transcription factor RLM1 n=1 Tax=Elsinoe australis TaxID=40998 RepID=A0A2P8AJF9_9PEZI|nr:Transcription factor RLM1 [Elsinoe australis]